MAISEMSIRRFKYALHVMAATTMTAAILLGEPAPAVGQISTACTSSMFSSFTPCMNFLTGSSNNGASPTTQCCASLSSLISGSTECACLILTGNVPVQLPINRTLAISLPRACNMGSVPLRCRAAATPLPAPGPVSFGPGLPPRAATAPETTTEPPAPSPDTPTDEPASPTPTDSLSPLNPATPGFRPVIQPSVASKLPVALFSPILLIVIGLAV